MSTATDRAARERKQKIFVAVGGVVLLGLLAVQVPKLLGGSEAAQSSASTVAAAGAPAAPTATPVASAGGPALPAVPPAELRSLSALGKRDPFVQQVATEPSVTEAAGAGAVKGEGSKQTSGKVPTREFTTSSAQAAAVTVIAVNGARQALETGAMFPASDPVFVLIAEQPKAKTVTIGVAGGEYANGAKAIKLRVGKPIVLENTATGARYRIVLVSVGSGAPSASRGATPESQPEPSP